MAVGMGWDGLVSINGTIMGVEGADFGKKGTILERAGLRGTRQHNLDDTVAGPYKVNGNVPVEPSQAELNALVALAMGASEALGTFTTLVDRSTAAFAYANCCLDKLTISGSQGGLIRANAEIIGTTEAGSTALSAPSSAAPLTFADVDLTLGAVTCKPQSFELKIDNAVDGERFLNSNTLTLNADSTHSSTDRIVTLRAVVPYDSDHSTLYDLAIAGVTGVLVIGTLTFTFGKLQAPAESVPLRKGELYLTLNLQARKSGVSADVATSSGA